MENKLKLEGVVSWSERSKRGVLEVDTYFIKVPEIDRKGEPLLDKENKPVTFSVKVELLSPNKKQVLFKKDSLILVVGRLKTNRWVKKGVDPKQAQRGDWQSETFVVAETISDASEPF